MKFRTILGAGLCLFIFASCASEDGRIESSLNFFQARSAIGSENSAPRQAYGLRQMDRLAHGGDVAAQVFLASRYLRGTDGLPQDSVLSAQYFAMLRADGNENGTRALIRLYGDADGAAYNPDALIALLSEDYEAGDIEAGLQLADFMADQGDTLAAQEVRLALIGRNSQQAQLDQAATLMDEDSPLYDTARGIALYEELSAQENPRALRELGLIYLRGTGVERDRDQAYDYLQRGLAAGDTVAGVQVASLQLYEDGPFYSPDSGYALLEDLALRGNSAAWLQLSRRDEQRYALLMQDVLRQDGAYVGPPTGEIDTLTLQSLAQWCPANNVPGDCTLELQGLDIARALARTARGL